MRPETSKALALFSGIATLALGSGFLLKLSTPKVRPQLGSCSPRMLELERAVCEPDAGAPPRRALTLQSAPLALERAPTAQ